MKPILCVSILLITFSLFSQIPEYEFINEPIEIITNFYDYMPGSYCGLPIQVEEDGSVYIVFHARETAAATRHIYFMYVDENGNLVNFGTIGQTTYQGYAGIDLDPVTGDPFVAWHENIDSTADLEVVLTYDLYHLGSPGLWRAPFAVIDDNTPSPNMPEDCFIWPEVHIGPSPIPDKRRVYVIAKNQTSSPVSGNPSENVLIAYADFDVNDLNIQSDLDWSYRTIELLDQWHNGNLEWIRPFISCSVSDDGQIAFMGYISADFEFGNLTDQIIVLHNDNFGEGDFEFYFQEAHYNVWYPGTTGELYFSPYLCHHQNSIFHENNSKISFLGTMKLMLEPSSSLPNLPAMYTKIYTFDTTIQEFSFYDLYLEGANPADDIPMIPWDLNEDGIVDSIGPNGEPVWPEGWPIYFYVPSIGFHEGNFKITQNEENGWLAAIWNDGLKARYAEEGVPGYENWLEKPEIAICISADNGESWSQPIFLNANETPELADMIPCYVYPGDKIEDLGNNHGKLHLFFLDDYSYGSYVHGNGQNLGGMQIYCALDIDFSPFVSMQPETIPQPERYLTNYPNPFNPETTITFSVPQTSSFVTITIYNIKGQKVKTLVNERLQAGEHSVVWDGRNGNNKSVSSGIYFYKLKAGNFEKSRKMLLMK
jgi:hypothetical protein